MAGAKRVTVTLTADRVQTLEEEATRKGLPLTLFCRLLLSEIADDFEEIKNRKAA